MFVGCTGNVVEDDYCASFGSPIDCLRANNNNVKPHHSEFSMFYRSKNDDQTLDGVAYVDSVSGKYLIELKAIDVLVFKGSIIGDDIKILFRTSTDTFEGIVGKLSGINLKRYTNLDFDIESILKVISLKIPLFDSYSTIDNSDKNTFELKVENVIDMLIFEQPPTLKSLVRKMYENDKLKMIYGYRYVAYKKETFGSTSFYFPQKTTLKYYPIDENEKEIKEERREIIFGIKKAEFKESFNESVFEFDFPDGIFIHYEG
jgi:hypothetical protein